MPPVGDLKSTIQNYVDKNKVMIFSKSTCPYCKKVKELFQSMNVDYFSLELNQTDDGADLQNALLEMTGQRTVPNVFINGKHLGGASDTISAKDDGRLVQLLGEEEHNYEYDLIVIGGGSGGLAASKRAAEHGKKVAVLDFVKPSPQGTSWGLGGTCVNVGCIPKKLMHQAALLREGIIDAPNYGWEYDQGSVKHNWATMVQAIQDHIGSLNWGYRVQLRNKSVKYVNAYGVFKDNHTIEATDKKGKVTPMTANHFIVATGGRPQYPDIPGAKEFCISSDDLFSLPYCPGKTLVIGASYVSLECAGFMAALGLDVTVCVRSILLRGFDQQIAEQIGDYMEEHGIKFIRPAVPTKIERLEEGQPGKYRVTMKSQIDGVEEIEEYNTVMFAVGRYVCTKEIGLDTVGVQLNPKNGKVISENEHTNVKNVHAIGDVLDGKPELTPVAIQAGRLLADRLFAGSNLQCDYINIPTTVFTPLEYGAIGYAEEVAMDKFGYENIEVYHTNFQPLEWTVAKRNENTCYAKLICNKADKERVIGLHVLGPNAGEITQGYGVAMKMGATKADFDRTIGIHPTCSEIFTTLNVTKSSGESTAQAGC